MENTDVLGLSTAPLTWHDFLERMRNPSAADFVKAIKSFIVSFLNNAPDPERDSAAVQEFLGNMEAAFRAHSLWAGCSEEELESAGEGLEKYVMTKLFTRTFASFPEDVKVDELLHEKIALVQQFVRPENLDIKPTFLNETAWLLAQKELQKINMYKAPRDKLVCILNCCKVINNLLINASVSANESPPGADDFLPVLIYVTIKANPPQLHSNLLYIQRFRHQNRLVSEAAYFFTNMLSAESFILNIDAKALSMDDSEFETNMEFARALLSGLSADNNVLDHSDHYAGPVLRTDTSDAKQSFRSRPQSPATQQKFSGDSSVTKPNEAADLKNQSSMEKIPSLSDLENRGASMLLKEDNVSQVCQSFPYLYSQAGDLTVGDVEELLSNYKHLVFKYVCLSKGLGITNASPPMSHNQVQTQLSEFESNTEPKAASAGEPSDEMQKDSHKDWSSMISQCNESKLEEDEAVSDQGKEGSEVLQM